ncbi:WYL domain-containing protein [Nocardioides sp. AE5]|uniref:helix-turn-helix transcriptional regulator n=1 Tax=Nocardioides sp. AE5 TaxID=2962573 RepID=UPI00288118C2|nr:WYL domain-containing protein [Nocardioides sp. AE5]MDT0200928.1 WYL domain-containing protein [Nocardioides sp. AE5]
MAAVPQYVARIARLPGVLAELAEHPGGMRLADLAVAVGADADELREDLLAYFTADPMWTLGLSRPSVLEFLGADGTEDDPAAAEVVRVVSEDEDLGVEHLSADELALIYSAAVALLDVDPDDKDLAAATEVISATMLGTADAPVSAEWNHAVPAFQEAVADRRRVRITYSRAWHVGVDERVIEPLRLVQTRRGWEVDAGPVGTNGALRTYLLSNVRAAELTDEVFEQPPGVEALLAEQRRTTRVRMELPHDARWTADMYAESVHVVGDDDATFTADLDLLEPVGWRVGLLMLAGGPETRVLDPAGLISAGPELARELLEHHRA